MIPTILNERYELKEKIGSGGMAVVYKAFDRVLARYVAIKILYESYNSDPEFIKRFQIEAKSAARLSHPNIVNIYDVEISENIKYIVMEYVPFDTLKNFLKDKGALDLLFATTIVKEIAIGLAYAHSNQIIHCDIKSHNILITADKHAKITDFGIARAVTESTMAFGGLVMGSVHYFSPEQARGVALTQKSDVYSLGIIFYEMLTNKLPFTGDNPVTIAMKHIEEEAIPPSKIRPEVPQIFDSIVSSMMNKNPNMRPSSAELVKELIDIEAALRLEIQQKLERTQVISRVEMSAQRIQHQTPHKNVSNNSPSQRKSTQPVAQKPFYRSKIFILMTAFVLMMGFGIGILATFSMIGTNGETVTVPEVKGKQLALARQILEDNKLRANVSEIYDANVPAGQVISQDPEVGKTVKSDRLVTIYVSKGGESIDMPDLVGLTKSAAIERLKKLNLNLGSVYEKESSSDTGTVLSQDPTSGKKIIRGQSVDLVFSSGVKKVEEPSVKVVRVPNVENASLSIAESGIIGSGLRVGSVTTKESNQADGTVISQNPSPNTEVETNSSVDLVVSRRVTHQDYSEPSAQYEQQHYYSDPPSNAPTRDENQFRE